jgi:hypothetical protein
MMNRSPTCPKVVLMAASAGAVVWMLGRVVVFRRRKPDQRVRVMRLQLVVIVRPMNRTQRAIIGLAYWVWASLASDGAASDIVHEPVRTHYAGSLFAAGVQK